MSGLDPFEHSMRKSLEQFEVPYNSADWAQLERALDSGKRASWVTSAGFFAFLAGALVVGSSIYWMSTRDTVEEGIAANTDLRTEQTVSPATPAANTESDEQAVVADDPSVPVTHEEATEPVPAVVSAGSGTQSANETRVTTAEAPKTGPKGPDSSTQLVIDDRSSDAAEPRMRVIEGCPGTTVEFAAEHLPESGIFLWNFGDGSFSNKPNPSHTYAKSGKFEVMLSHSLQGGGNIHSKPSSDLIVVHEAPEAVFSAQKQEYNGQIPSVHFENRSLGGVQYHWDFSDGSTSTIAHPDHVFRKKGDYTVELVVTNEKGCVDRHERVVRIEEDYNLLAPSSFSPNGDGTNDLFMPEALHNMDLKFHMVIYDQQTGTMVYETSDATKPWTGRVMNRGDLAAPGIYVWVVEFQNGLHLSETPFQGEVNLVR